MSANAFEKWWNGPQPKLGDGKFHDGKEVACESFYAGMQAAWTIVNRLAAGHIHGETLVEYDALMMARDAIIAATVTDAGEEIDMTAPADISGPLDSTKDRAVIPAGDVIHVRGFPFQLVRDTEVFGANIDLAIKERSCAASDGVKP